MGIPILGAIFTRYPVDVEIYERREVGFCILPDKGRRYMRKDGKYEYQLKNAKVKTKPINPESIYITPGGKHKLKLYSPIPGVYQAVTFDIEKMIQEQEIIGIDGEKKKIKTMGKYNIIDEDTRRWLANDAAETFQRFKEKKSFLEAYAPLLMMISFCVLYIVIQILFYGNLEQLTQILGEINSALERSFSLISGGPPH